MLKEKLSIELIGDSILCSDYRYAGIIGIQPFINVSLAFGYGEDSAPLRENRIAATQCLSGTGGCRLMGELVSKFFGGVKIYIPNPTWSNHVAVFKNAGLDPVYYRYYDSAAKSVDFTGLMEDIKNADDGSLFMLHSCAHNPTGCDPSREQWDQLSVTMKEKKHMVFFDCAYQVMIFMDRALVTVRH